MTSPFDFGPLGGGIAGDAVRIAEVPRDADVTYIKGTASDKTSAHGVVYEGGGVQYRFREFDESWVITEIK